MQYYSLGIDGNGSNASASTTKSYHNGGVEGDSLAGWYEQNLADRFTDYHDDNHGSGSGGTKGSGSGGTRGSGSGGTKGSGSGGTRGSGSGGTSGSGSGGTKGSGSGGTRGSGSGGTSGSGSKEPHGPECETPDDTGSDKPTLNYIMGTDPQVAVAVTQTPSGSLFFDLKPASPDTAPADINGLFFDLAADSGVASLMFSPEANQGSQYSPVTGTQADANAVDTLPDGTTAPGPFDAALQFGTQEGSTNGLVQSVNFTLWSTDGPLTFADINLDGMTILADSGPAGSLVMTVTGSDEADCDHNGGIKSSGSGGTSGSGSGGTGGSGPGGTGGSGPGGTGGSGSGGTRGSGSGGTSGSGSGGTGGSGSGGTGGSGSGGTGGASASATKSYHNGGVEGDAFSDWYANNLADKFNDPIGEGVPGAGTGGTQGTGTGGTQGTGTGGSQAQGSPASGSGPGLSDVLALMTRFPEEDDPSLNDQQDPWDETEPDLLI